MTLEIIDEPKEKRVLVRDRSGIHHFSFTIPYGILRYTITKLEEIDNNLDQVRLLTEKELVEKDVLCSVCKKANHSAEWKHTQEEVITSQQK